MTSKGGPSSTVLVIEDDAALRQLYRYTFSMRGLRVEFAADGLTGLLRLDELAPAAIVLDLGLPRLSGRAVLDEVIAAPATRDLPLVVVTALDPAGLPPDVLVLRKPVDPEEVVSAISRLTREHRRHNGNGLRSP
jgi:CheY-like chemotaxis protein